MSRPAMQTAIVLAPRSAAYSRKGFQEHYEDYHAPLFYSFARIAIGRYLRNHILRAIGDDPPFDTISEFGNYPEKRAELRAVLASPEAKALEDDVKSFLAERGNVFEIAERPIAGPPRGFEAGPVAKRMVLLKKSADQSAEAFASAAGNYAREIARGLGLSAARVTLTVWKTDPIPPMDAMVTIWPADGVGLPDAFPPDAACASRGIEIRYAVDVESYCTAWCD